MKKIIIAGGSGFLGTLLAKHLSKTSEIVVLSRKKGRGHWNGRDRGDWVNELEGAYAIINLAGKNVNCRYTPGNKKEILESRILSTKVLGEAVASLKNPPKVWLQSASATIYRHSEDKAMDETFGDVGDDFSMDLCKEWERSFNDLQLNGTRKVIMRISIVMGHDGGALPLMRNMVKFGLGGRQGDGKQMMSRIHEDDVVGVVDWMLNGDASGVYNVTSP